MAAPVITWTDTSDVLNDSAAPLAVVNATPGATTFAGTLRVHNDLAGVGGIDDAIGYGILAQARIKDTSAEFEAEGFQVLDAGGFRISVSATSPEGTPGSPLALGGDTVFPAPDIPAGSFLEIDIEFVLPADVSASALEFILDHVRTKSGLIGPHPNGLQTGRGDSTTFQVAHADGVFTAATAPDDTVVAPRYTVVVQGVARHEPASVLTFDDLDGSAQALLAGESYAALILDTVGGRTVVKGDKSAGTPTTPTATSGSLSRALVIVPFGLVIVSVTPLGPTDGNFFAAFAGSDVIVSGGFAHADRRELFPRTSTTISLSAFISAEVDVYTDQEGELLTTLRGVPLQGAPLPLWRAITDGGGLVTDLQDLRKLAAGQVYG
jgi:hypothetical protein